MIRYFKLLLLVFILKVIQSQLDDNDLKQSEISLFT